MDDSARIEIGYLLETDAEPKAVEAVLMNRHGVTVAEHVRSPKKCRRCSRA